MRHLKATSDVVGVSGARRWSTATQSITGLSNTSHQSLPVNEDSRKISFVLQDQDNESIGSSKNSLSGAVSTTQHNNKIIWEQKNIINSTIQLFTLLWTRNYSFCCILQLIQSQKTVLLLRVFLIVFVWSWLVVIHQQDVVTPVTPSQCLLVTIIRGCVHWPCHIWTQLCNWFNTIKCHFFRLKERVAEGQD